MVGPGLRIEGIRRLAGDLGPVVVEEDELAGIGRERTRRLLLREQHRDATLFKHELQSLAGKRRVQRYVRAAGLKDAQQPNYHF